MGGQFSREGDNAHLRTSAGPGAKIRQPRDGSSMAV